MRTQINNPLSLGSAAFFILLFSSLFFSCTNEDLQENISGKETKEITLKMSVDEANAIKIKKTGSFIIPESEAIEMVRQRYMKDALTKSGDNCIIKSCQKVPLPTMQTKSSTDEVPGYYVVEFISEGKEGFSMVSADRRIEEVFAYSEYGSLSDTAYNEGLKMFCEGLPYYIEEKIERFNTDSLYNVVSDRLASTKSGWIDDGPIHYLYMQQGFLPDPDYVYMGEETIGDLGTEYGTILTTQWGQGYPYNNKLPYIEGASYQRAYAGCVIIATAQIMAYHKKPYQNITTSDWSNFSRTAQCYDEKLQDCILSIFNAIPNKNITTTGTGAYHGDAKNFLSNQGFQTTYTSYSVDLAVAALQHGPALVTGFNPTTGKGHTWVVDSQRHGTNTTYDKYEKDDGYDIWRIYVEKTAESGPYWVHCNWGNYSSSDGWFVGAAFHTQNFNYTQNVQISTVKL